MDEVLYYLELKNQFFEKLLAMTEEFLSKTKQNLWSRVNQFTEDREHVLHMIHSFESKIADKFSALQLSGEEVSFYQSRVKELFRKREWLVRRIVSLDLELIGKIDEVKSERILELTHTSPNLPIEIEVAPKLEKQN
jgi:molybdopterin-biosynthesis enzyme MoeA-like protein